MGVAGSCRVARVLTSTGDPVGSHVFWIRDPSEDLKSLNTSRSLSFFLP